MANTDAPFGLKPIGHLLGLNWSDTVRKCTCSATANADNMFIGDPVVFEGTADATGAYPTIDIATPGATNSIMGVIVGFEPDPNDLSLLYRKASTARYAFVCMDPFVIYEIQASTDAVLAVTAVGANGVLIATHSGSTSTGLSGMELSTATTPAADATYQVNILQASDDPWNDVTAVNARWHVLLNLSVFRAVYDTHATAWYGSLGV